MYYFLFIRNFQLTFTADNLWSLTGFVLSSSAQPMLKNTIYDQMTTFEQYYYAQLSAKSFVKPFLVIHLMYKNAPVKSLWELSYVYLYGINKYFKIKGYYLSV